jgi:hypothetical protein
VSIHEKIEKSSPAACKEESRYLQHAVQPLVQPSVPFDRFLQRTVDPFFRCEDWKTFDRFREKASLGVRKDFVVSFRAIICVCKKRVTASFSKRSCSHSHSCAEYIQDKLIQCSVSIATSLAACCALKYTASFAAGAVPKHV